MFYKIFTHDLRSPIRPGRCLWDGSLPHTLPSVHLDTSARECGEGWHFCHEAAAALSTVGLWPGGYACRLFEVEPVGPVVDRGDKCRAAQIRIIREITAMESVIDTTFPIFGNLQQEMAHEQFLWWEALRRPLRDVATVEACLREALRVRRLTWMVELYAKADLLYADRADWEDRKRWWAPTFPRNTFFKLLEKKFYVQSILSSAWGVGCRCRFHWEADVIFDVFDGLSVYYTACRNVIPAIAAEDYTVGIREAYRHGLRYVAVTQQGTLGYVMEDGDVL